MSGALAVYLHRGKWLAGATVHGHAGVRNAVLHVKRSCLARQSADTWACGVMLFIMLSSAYPFGRPEDEQLKPSAKMHVMLQVHRLHTSPPLLLVSACDTCIAVLVKVAACV